MRILVVGGTGFIGRHLVAKLVADGHVVIIPTRRYVHGRDLLPLPTVILVEANVHEDGALNRLVQGCDAVINLVGILHGRRGQPYGPDFKRAHVDLPARLAQACVRHGVRQFLHVSALGAHAQAPSGYLRSKAAGEQAILDAYEQRNGTQGHSGYAIFRPSVVFGPDDQFMNLFARLAHMLPVIFLAGAHSRLQPVYVGDVVKALVSVTYADHAPNRSYALVGPQVYTLAQLVSLAARWSGSPRWVVPVPNALGYAQALLLECLPGEPLMSRDNLDSLKVDNVSNEPLPPELGVIPTPLEAVAPRYLLRHTGQGAQQA